MGAVRKLVIEVSEENADRIEEMVRTGEFASADDVVGAALDALSLNDDEVEHWLRSEVVPSIKRSRADPGRLRSSEEVRAHLKELHRKAEAGEL